MRERRPHALRCGAVCRRRTGRRLEKKKMKDQEVKALASWKQNLTPRSLPGEEWRAILGWKGFEVSSRGRVRKPNGKIAKAHLSMGYPRVHLGKTRRRTHILVAAAFLGPRLLDIQVNHKDGNRLNNCLGNLEYVTPAENNLHAYRVLGKKRRYAKLNPQKVREVRAKRLEGRTLQSLADEYKVSYSAIRNLVLRLTWIDVD